MEAISTAQNISTQCRLADPDVSLRLQVRKPISLTRAVGLGHCGPLLPRQVSPGQMVCWHWDKTSFPPCLGISGQVVPLHQTVVRPSKVKVV